VIPMSANRGPKKPFQTRIKKVAGLVALVAASVVISPVTPAQADTRPPCGGHVIDGTYYFTNCRINAVRVAVDVAFETDFKICVFGKEYRKYVRDATFIRGTTVDKIYNGDNYHPNCPWDD
jgi:hypothetical protein